MLSDHSSQITSSFIKADKQNYDSVGKECLLQMDYHS